MRQNASSSSFTHFSNTQIRQKTELVLEHLIVRLCMESRVFHSKIFFRMNDFTEILFIVCKFRAILRRSFYQWMNINQLAHQSTDFLIEIPKERELFLVKHPKIIGIILKERTVTIVRNQRIPMHVPPIAMIRNTHILHWTFQRFTLFCRNGQYQRAIGSGNHTTVTIRLLYIIVITLDTCFVCRIEFGIIFHRSQVGRS